MIFSMGSARFSTLAFGHLISAIRIDRIVTISIHLLSSIMIDIPQNDISIGYSQSGSLIVSFNACVTRLTKSGGD